MGIAKLAVNRPLTENEIWEQWHLRAREIPCLVLYLFMRQL
jgi:hypothetical protein